LCHIANHVQVKYLPRDPFTETKTYIYIAVGTIPVAAAHSAQQSLAMEQSSRRDAEAEGIRPRRTRRVHGFHARTDYADDERRPEIVSGEKRQERIEVAMTLHGIPQGLAPKKLIQQALREYSIKC
jgi:hypothetical protein